MRDCAWRFIRDRCPGCVWDLALTDSWSRRSQLMHLGDHHWPITVLCGKQDFQKESTLKRSYMCQGPPCQDTKTPEGMSVSCAWRKIASFPLTKKAFSARKNRVLLELCARHHGARCWQPQSAHFLPRDFAQLIFLYDSIRRHDVTPELARHNFEIKGICT